jgi:hypothetical protein
MNRMPSPVINNKTPYFLIHNQHPDFNSLKVFGSLAYMSLCSHIELSLLLEQESVYFLATKLA